MFPIVVGTGPHHSSARPFPSISHSEDHSDDQNYGADDVRQHQHQHQHAIMAMGTTDDETLNATMFISYHFIPILDPIGDAANGSHFDDDEERRALLERDATTSRSSNHTTNEWKEMGGQNSISSPLDPQYNIITQFNVIAELRVQITPITAPYTSNLDAMSNRETKCRVPLGVMQRQLFNDASSFLPHPSIEFSSNKHHLACLIPFPSGYELSSSSSRCCDGHTSYPASTIVIYRIQAKTAPSQERQQQRKLKLPKLPDYILDNSIDDESRMNGELEDTTIPTKVDEVDMGGVSAPTIPSSISRANSTSFVAHGPKIVRDLVRPMNKQHAEELLETPNNELPHNRRSSFRRKLLSSENSHSSGSPLQGATCMCNAPSDHNRGESSSAASFLLVGTIHGTLITVDYSMARVRSNVPLNPILSGAGKVHDDRIRGHPVDPNQRKSHHSECGGTPIVHLSQCTPTYWKPLNIYGDEQGSMSKGRLAAVYRDGSVTIYATSFMPISSVHRDTLLLDKNGKNDDSSKHPRRLNRNNNNESNQSGLGMVCHLMASFRASASHLRYIRAKWIKQCILALLTRSSLLDDDVSSGSSDYNMSGSQSEMVVAQVWSVVAEGTRANRANKEGMWEIPTNGDGDIALMSELKLPRGDGLNEFIHDTFSLTQDTSNPVYDAHSNMKRRLGFSECTRGMSILHHRFIDCLALGFQEVTCTSDSNGFTKIVRPVCLIWDWKRNVPGFTLASCISYRFCQQQDNAGNNYSWFQLGNDDKYGLCAVHVYEQTLRKDMRRACKNIFVLSALSPRNRLSNEMSLIGNEPSALLLHGDSVTFPRICRPTNSLDISLEWAESRVPPSYIASNGPCQIAAVGKDYGRSIAVAAPRGLCVLDLSRSQQLDFERLGSTYQSPRWKQFSNVNDEHRFRVLSMIWWETANQDFLLAVVQYKLNDALRLVCWSARTGIGFGESQLLTGINTTEANEEAYDYGMALPSDFHVHSMSLIKDPADKIPGSRAETSSRALLLLAYVDHSEPASCSIKYVLCQLQIVFPSGNQERVFTRMIARGNIPMGLGNADVTEDEVITGIFVAGGSFLFNLDRAVEDPDSHHCITVIGVITLFHDLIAVCIRQDGYSFYRPSVLGQYQEGARRQFVSYWEAGSISSSNGARIAWSIAKNDGTVFCWSVPCTNASSIDQQHEEHEGPSSEFLLGIEMHPTFGEFCYLGLSSLWMNGAATSEREVALGPFIPQSFGSILYAGQRCRKPTSPFGPAAMTPFHVSNCIVAPPQFTPFLYLSFLTLSLESSPRNGSDWQLLNIPNQAYPERRIALSRELAKDVINSTLRQLRSLGSSSSALRIITLKVIELLNDSKVKRYRFRESEVPNGTGIGTTSDGRKWKVGKAMLLEIVAAASMIFDELGFATFFLSIGRQLEPHQFNLIFPLPEGSPASTAEGLFILSCEHGSLLTALSALPLFSSHKESQRSVTKLVYHCLIKIDESFRSCFSGSAVTSVEDERFLHQLFWFGVKLEDAIDIENLHADDEASLDGASQSEESIIDSSQMSIASSSTESGIGDEFGSVDSDSADFISNTCSSDESFERSFLSHCQTPKQKPANGIFQLMTKRFLAGSGSSINNCLQEEDAIHEAASSFIHSGLYGASITSRVDDASIYNRLPFTSVAGAVCLFIDHEIVSGGIDKQQDLLRYGWKAVSLVAKLLQGERGTSAITSAGSENSKAVCRMLTINDFVAAYPPPGNVRMQDNVCCEFVASVLDRITLRCRQQIHTQALDSVFNLVLLLLLRNNTCPDVKMCTPTLTVVGIVSGHLSGRIGELLDLAEASTVNSIYSLYAARLES